MPDSADPFDFDIDSANNVEETAYEEGYQQGFDHGALHGTFEGRELGRDKGFELWEEVAFYQGMAEVWRECLEQADAARHTSRKQTKQIQHLAGLEKLISFFPMTNTSSDPSLDLGQPTTDETVAVDADDTDDAEVAEDGHDDELAKLDMLTLLEKVRAKYRLTCSVLGIPSQRTTTLAEIADASHDGEASPSSKTDAKTVLVAGKLVDPSQLKY
ncbi:Essential protein Yae1, N-terminal [Kalmanozyma brasiliensis GHG001]|nr:Essential protein Yae1, N-terminal [Kalmanozyma brasiliensis GHG001]KAF6766995.1 Essential protein Yae1, N-terminal [Kalmanozyma brasiliensis GHG001]